MLGWLDDQAPEEVRRTMNIENKLKLLLLPAVVLTAIGLSCYNLTYGFRVECLDRLLRRRP